MNLDNLRIREIKNILFILICLLAIFIVFGTAGYLASASNVVIIANKNVPEDTLSIQEIRDVYLGDKTRWSNKKPIEFSILRKGNVHSEFLTIYINKSSKNFVRYWKRKILTGEAKMPLLLNSEDEVLEHVSKNETGLGYTSSEYINEHVKIISISR